MDYKGALVDQPNAMPTRKAMAATMFGSLLTIALWYAETFHEVRMDAGTQGAFHTLVGFMVMWFFKDRENH